MLLVGIPLLLLVQVPMQQKIGVIVVFGMGIFVIVAAILNKVYSTVPSLLNDSINYTFWYMREATVGVYIINLPALWPVLRKLFPILTGRGSSAANSRDTTSNNLNSRPWLASGKRTQISSHTKDDTFEMNNKRQDVDADSEGESTTQMGRSGFNTSQERIIENGFGNRKGGLYNDSNNALEINHNVTFTVEHSRNMGTPLPAKSPLDGRKLGGGYQANVQAINKNDSSV